MNVSGDRAGGKITPDPSSTIDEWLLSQRWEDTLFCSWPAAGAALRNLVPTGLTIDEWGGTAWVTVVALWITAVRLGESDPLPGFDYPEINLRTYVTGGGVAGVWFFSLDTNHAATVRAGRSGFSLPYFLSDMSMDRGGPTVVRSARADGSATCLAEYQPYGSLFGSESSSLEYFLTERYAMFTSRADGTVLRGDIRHEPWTLRAARAKVDAQGLVVAAGVDIEASSPHLLHGAALDVRFTPLREM